MVLRSEETWQFEKVMSWSRSFSSTGGFECDSVTLERTRIFTSAPTKDGCVCFETLHLSSCNDSIAEVGSQLGSVWSVGRDFWYRLACTLSMFCPRSRWSQVHWTKSVRFPKKWYCYRVGTRTLRVTFISNFWSHTFFATTEALCISRTLAWVHLLVALINGVAKNKEPNFKFDKNAQRRV